MFADPVIEEVSTVLRIGDSLALYTDGLIEAHAPARTVTPEQMIEQLQRRSPAGAQEAIDALLGLVELDEHVRDDIAILSARVVPASAAVAAPAQRRAGAAQRRASRSTPRARPRARPDARAAGSSGRGHRAGERLLGHRAEHLRLGVRAGGRPVGAERLGGHPGGLDGERGGDRLAVDGVRGRAQRDACR